MVQTSKTHSHICMNIWSSLHWSDKIAAHARRKARTRETKKKKRVH